MFVTYCQTISCHGCWTNSRPRWHSVDDVTCTQTRNVRRHCLRAEWATDQGTISPLDCTVGQELMMPGSQDDARGRCPSEGRARWKWYPDRGVVIVTSARITYHPPAKPIRGTEWSVTSYTAPCMRCIRRIEWSACDPTMNALGSIICPCLRILSSE